MNEIMHNFIMKFANDYPAVIFGAMVLAGFLLLASALVSNHYQKKFNHHELVPTKWPNYLPPGWKYYVLSGCVGLFAVGLLISMLGVTGYCFFANFEASGDESTEAYSIAVFIYEHFGKAGVLVAGLMVAVAAWARAGFLIWKLRTHTEKTGQSDIYW